MRRVLEPMGLKDNVDNIFEGVVRGGKAIIIFIYSFFFCVVLLKVLISKIIAINLLIKFLSNEIFVLNHEEKEVIEMWGVEERRK
jgi:hypothetical protein